MTRDEAVNWIINISADIGKAEHSELWHYEQALSEIREMLESEPERKTGKWIKKEKCYPDIEKQMDYRYECSECGFSDIHNATLEVPFCWHCGADMRGD